MLVLTRIYRQLNGLTEHQYTDRAEERLLKEALGVLESAGKQEFDLEGGL